jgi:hypothetical protein
MRLDPHSAATSEFRFGRGTCCWKPLGCTMTERQGCRLMRHPVKRAVLLNDPTVPCPNGWVLPDPETGVETPMTCALLNGHVPPCVPVDGRFHAG